MKNAMNYKPSALPLMRLPLLALLCAAMSGCGGASGSGAASSVNASQTVTTSGATTVNVTSNPGSTTLGNTPSADIGTSVLYTVGDGAIIDETATAEVADNAGNLYVADVNQQLVWKITPTGTASTYVGNTSGATLQYNLGAPQGLAIDPAGNLYIGTADNIVKVTPSGAISTPYQTAAVYAVAPGGYTNQMGVIYPAQQFAVDASGNLFTTVPCSGIVRKVTPSGAVTTLASGLAMQTSQLQIPDEGVSLTQCSGGATGIAIDAKGNVFAADTYNQVILKIAANGTVSTLAGSAGVSGTADGSGSTASFTMPQTMSMDAGGNLYVADAGLIRKITPQGVVTTLVGGTGSHAAVNLPNTAAAAEFGPTAALVFGGNLYTLTTYSTTGWALVKFSNLPQ